MSESEMWAEYVRLDAWNDQRVRVWRTHDGWTVARGILWATTYPTWEDAMRRAGDLVVSAESTPLPVPRVSWRERVRAWLCRRLGCECEDEL